MNFAIKLHRQLKIKSFVQKNRVPWKREGKEGNGGGEVSGYCGYLFLTSKPCPNIHWTKSLSGKNQAVKKICRNNIEEQNLNGQIWTTQFSCKIKVAKTCVVNI